MEDVFELYKLWTRLSRALNPQVALARYMSSYTRDSSDLHIYKDLYGERNKPEKLPLNYNKNRLSEFQCRFLCVLCDFLTDLERFSVV